MITFEELLALARQGEPGNATRQMVDEIDRLRSRVEELEDRVLEYGDERYWDGYDAGSDAARDEL